MLRHTLQSSISRSFSYSKRRQPCPSLSFPHSSISTARRHFFFGSGNDNDDDDDKKDKDKNKKEKKDTDKDNEAEKKEPSATLDNSSKYKPRTNRASGGTTSGNSSGNNVLLPASRLGFGDQAPRYPHLMALPVTRGPVFPGVLTPVTVTDKKTIQAVEKIISGSGGGYLGLFCRKDYNPSHDAIMKGIETPELITDANDLYSVGTFAQIHRMTNTVDLYGTDDLDEDSDDGEHDEHHPLNDYSKKENDDTHTTHDKKPSATILLMPHRRIDLLSVDSIGPPIDVTVSHWDRLTYIRGQDSVKDDTIRALCQEVLGTIREVAQLNTLFKEQVVNLVPSSHMFDMNDPYRLADFAASLSINGGEVGDLQSVLEEKDAELRLHKALVLLSKEREVGKLQKEISAKVEEKMSEAQRKYFLMEQLKSIKKELGMEKDDKESLIEKYRKTMAGYAEVPVEINEIFESELDKLSTLEKNSSEFNVTRSYLDWLTSIPWGVTTEENFDIKAARMVLDRDHYGMIEVKETILKCH